LETRKAIEVEERENLGFSQNREGMLTKLNPGEKSSKLTIEKLIQRRY